MDSKEYQSALEELDRIASKVEDPATGIDDIDALIKRADALIDSCRRYLRTAREKTELLGRQ